MSFQTLKKNRKNIEVLQKKLAEGAKKSYEDNRFWKCERDKSGNGRAVIRFLPAPEGEDVPWVEVYSHGFQMNGRWFINNCPTSIKADCPVCQFNSNLWNSGVESDKKIVRGGGGQPGTKRKLRCISNILVVDDPVNPENNGKVFLFSYGKKIFDQIKSELFPEFDDVNPCDVFDLWSGKNFNLRIRQHEGFPNYDKCSWSDPSAVLDGDDKELEALWKTEHSLQAFLSPTEFKSETELAGELNRVMGSASAEGSAESSGSFGDDAEVSSSAKADAAIETSDEDSDEATAYFKRLANTVE